MGFRAAEVLALNVQVRAGEEREVSLDLGGTA